MSLVQQQQQHHHQNNLDTKSYRFCSLDRMNWKRSNLWHLLRRPNTFENDRIKAREVQNFLSALFLEKDNDNDDKIIVSLPRGMSVLSRRNKNIRRWCETWMSAIYCVQRRLRTQYGRAADMFENLENAVKRSVEKDIVCCGSSAYLLEFADAMDKLINLAHTGTLFTAREEMFDFPIQYFVPSHNCSNFFQKNRHVCEYWMSRIRRHLQRLALNCGASAASARHGLLHLSSSTDVDETTIRQIVMSLYQMGDSDAIWGVKEFFQEKLKASLFDEICVDAILHMSQGHYEIAYRILKSLLMEKHQKYNAETHQFLATRLVECALHSKDTSNLECVWKIVRVVSHTLSHS